MIVNCRYCEKEIKITESRYKRGNGKFCSNECRLKAKARTKVKLICENCGKKFELWKRKRVKNIKCCSLKCAGEYKKKRIKTQCYKCGKIFDIKPFQVSGSKSGYFFCSVNCYNKYRTNEKLSVNLKVHNNLQYRSKRKILKRDGFACQLCGESPHDLTVDHILPVNYFVTRYRTVEACLNKGVNNPINLQTLCFDCNRKKGIKVTNPAKINGIVVADIAKVCGIS